MIHGTNRVLAMRQSDESALATLYDRHSAVILGFLLRLMRERADAEPVLLETFLQASRSAERFDAQRSNVLSWLMMIARTRALDALRVSARQLALVPRSLGDLTAAELERLHATSAAGIRFRAERPRADFAARNSS